MGGAPTACVPHHCPELAMGAPFSEGPEAPGLPGPRVPGPVLRTLCCRTVDLAFSGLWGCPRGHPWGHWAGQRTQDPKHSSHSFVVEPPARRPRCPEPRRPADGHPTPARGPWGSHALFGSRSGQGPPSHTAQGEVLCPTQRPFPGARLAAGAPKGGAVGGGGGAAFPSRALAPTQARAPAPRTAQRTGRRGGGPA